MPGLFAGAASSLDPRATDASFSMLKWPFYCWQIAQEQRDKAKAPRRGSYAVLQLRHGAPHQKKGGSSPFFPLALAQSAEMSMVRHTAAFFLGI